jgi:hypothetical protein
MCGSWRGRRGCRRTQSLQTRPLARVEKVGFFANLGWQAVAGLLRGCYVRGHPAMHVGLTTRIAGLPGLAVPYLRHATRALPHTCPFYATPHLLPSVPILGLLSMLLQVLTWSFCARPSASHGAASTPCTSHPHGTTSSAWHCGSWVRQARRCWRSCDTTYQPATPSTSEHDGPLGAGDVV